MSKSEIRSGRSSLQQNQSGEVTGRVTLENTDQGIPGLIIEIFDVGGREPSRLGSVRTDSTGSFTLRYPIVPRRRSWWSPPTINVDLQLEILTPERINSDRHTRLIYCSPLRPRAGKKEQFSIELDEQILHDKNVPIPGEQAIVDSFGKPITTWQKRAEQLKNVREPIIEESLKEVEENRTLFRDEIQPRIIKEITSVSEEERKSDRFVPSDKELVTKYREAVKTDLLTLSEQETDPDTGTEKSARRRRGRIVLSEAQRAKLIGDSEKPVTLTEDELEEELGTSLDKPPVVYRFHLEPDPCRPKTDADKCLDEPDVGNEGNHGDGDGGDTGDGDSGDETPNGDDNPNGDGAIPGDNIEILRDTIISTLTDRLSAPEDPVVFGPQVKEDPYLEPQLDASEVGSAISKLAFEPGPADVPAFYEFHDLQIAFEPVWQEALDDTYLNNVEAAYDRYVDLAGNPGKKKIKDLMSVGNIDFFAEAFLDAVQDMENVTNTKVPAVVAATIFISLEEWRALPKGMRDHLEELASRIADYRELILDELDPDNYDAENFGVFFGLSLSNSNAKVIPLLTQIRLLTSDANRIVAHARRLILEKEAEEAFQPTHQVIQKLRNQRLQSYPFRHFAANRTNRSVNFGIIVTYLQEWTPLAYQVGQLVSTIPMMPGEEKTYSKKTVVRTKRAEKEIESNLVSQQTSSEEKNNAESEIVSRATAKTNFSLTSEGSMSMALGEGISAEGSLTSTFSRDVEKHSQSVKKEFREAIFKSAQEFKNERKVEINFEESFEEEISETGKIRNENNEIPVTFLFYELQRRFRVAEKIHRVRSVVLVAQEVPKPSEITKEWMIRYDWIINRFLLDDSFRPALTYLSTSLVSENIALKEMRDALFRQRKLVEEIKEEVADRRSLAGLRYGALQRQIERTARSADSDGGFFGAIGDVVSAVPGVGDLVAGGIDLLTGGGDEGASEAAQIREGAARDAFDRERREEEALTSRLFQSISTLETMERRYAERLAEHLRQLAQCERLAIHIRDNILVYMQAIWAYEPADQRFLRLRNVPVPVFKKQKNLKKYSLEPAIMADYATRALSFGGYYGFDVDVGVKPPAPADDIETVPLSEVADLDTPLGFKGNYMIFPMTESNPITEFMMEPYVTLAEGEYGVSDPDPLGNMNLDEFSEYVCCLKKHFDEKESGSGGDDVSPREETIFESLKPFLREALKKLLQLSLRNNDIVVVPSDQLYIEALPGTYSVLEKFKLLHRAIDVKDAQADLREHELENLRRALRLLQGDFEDPEIEAKYLFKGDAAANFVLPEPSDDDGS